MLRSLGVLGLRSRVGKIPVGLTAEFLIIRDKTLGDIGLRLDVLVAVEEMAEGILSEVAGMLEHYIEDDLDPLGVGSIDKILKIHILRAAPLRAALITEINSGEIHGMIAVIVEP